MSKDNLPVVALGFGGFALFVAFISGSVWYMSNWAESAVEPTSATADSELVVSVQSAPTDEMSSPSPGSTQPGGASGGPGSGQPGGGARPTPPGQPVDPGRTPDAAQPAEPGRLPDGGRRPGEGVDSAREASRPRIAVVIDDWGYEWEMAEAFIGFPEPLTVAVLPFLPYSQDHAVQAAGAGHQVILHMPMEAQNEAVDIGPGGIRTTMDDDEIAERVAAALAHIPGVSGLNNHMGSRATADQRLMDAVLDVIDEQQLFFLDSYTAATTIGHEVARERAVPYAVNQVFLDHVDTEEHVRGQIARLVRLAEQRGHAIGIGHVRPNTYAALVGMLPELRVAGIEFVPISELLLVPVGEDGAVEWVLASSESGAAARPDFARIAAGGLSRSVQGAAGLESQSEIPGAAATSAATPDPTSAATLDVISATTAAQSGDESMSGDGSESDGGSSDAGESNASDGELSDAEAVEEQGSTDPVQPTAAPREAADSEDKDAESESESSAPDEATESKAESPTPDETPGSESESSAIDGTTELGEPTSDEDAPSDPGSEPAAD